MPVYTATVGSPEKRVLTRVLVTAGVVALVDQLSKLVAGLWVHGDVGLAPGLSLTLVHNPAGPLGVSLGGWTRGLNVVLALVTIGLVLAVARDLARAVRHATLALGLIAGASLGNLLSIALTPAGVPDFVAVEVRGKGIVLNAADIAAYAGVVLLVVAAFQLVTELRARLRVRAEQVRPAAAVLALRTHEREVVRPVFVEGREPAQPARGERVRPLGVPGSSRGDRAGERTRVLPLSILEGPDTTGDGSQAGDAR
jgi:lipoprotein signal peptidase